MVERVTEEENQLSLASITRGASLFFVGRLTSKGLKFVLNLLLARGLGASLYGIYAYSMTIISFIVIFSRLGSGKSLLKFIPSCENEPQRRDFFVGLAYSTGLTVSVIVGIALYSLAPTVSRITIDNPLFVDVLRILAIVLPFNVLIGLTSSVFQGTEQLEYKILTAEIGLPFMHVAFAGIALFLGYSLQGVVVGVSAGTVLISIAAITILYDRTTVRPSVSSSQSRSNVARFYNFSIPLTMKEMGSILYNRIDILMVGFFLTESVVGIYQVSVLVATLLILPLTAFNQLFPPVASRLYSNDEINQLESIYETVTRWSLTVAIFPALIFAIFSSEVLSIFGPEFSNGWLVLTLFTVAQLTSCAVGPSGYVLMMTDHQYLTLINQWMLGILNIGLNYLFIIEFGMVGAAMATAAILSLINIVRIIEVWYTEDILPYSMKFVKPLAAGLITGALMYGCSIFFEGAVLLVGGSFIGGLTFVCLLFLFGIEEQDQEIFYNFAEERL